MKISDEKYRGMSEGMLLKLVCFEYELSHPDEKGIGEVVAVLKKSEHARTENHILSCMKDQAHLGDELWLILEAGMMEHPHYSAWHQVKTKLYSNGRKKIC